MARPPLFGGFFSCLGLFRNWQEFFEPFLLSSQLKSRVVLITFVSVSFTVLVFVLSYIRSTSTLLLFS